MHHKFIIVNIMLSDEEIKARILHKLARLRMWGGKHTSFDNLAKGFSPRHLGKGGRRRIKQAGEQLMKEGILLWKPTEYGKEVFLNPRMKDKVIEIIKRYIKLEEWEEDIYLS